MSFSAYLFESWDEQIQNVEDTLKTKQNVANRPPPTSTDAQTMGKETLEASAEISSLWGNGSRRMLDGITNQKTI